MKKLLLIGNKLIDKDISAKVDAYDYVVRVNRMNNIPNTGTKINGYYLGMWKDFREKYHGGEHKELIKNAEIVFCCNRVYKNTQNIFDYITQEQYDNVEIIDIDKSRKGIGTKFPTSTISVLWHLVNSHWADEYEISITGIDIEGRDELFRTNWEWASTAHITAGKAEADYMLKLISEGKIKVLEV